MPHDPHLATRPMRDLLGFGLGFVGVALFGGTLPMTRIAVTVFDPLFVTTGRAAIASVFAALLLVVARRRLPPRRVHRSLAIAALCSVIGFPLFMGIAMVTVPASHGGVVLGIMPLGTTVAAVFVNGERPSGRFWVLSGVGALLVLVFTLRNGDVSFGYGDLALVAAGGTAAVGYAHFARIGREIPGWEAISWALVLSAPLTVTVTALGFEPAYLDAPMPAVGALLYVALFSVFIGFFFWNAGLVIGGVARVGQVQLLQTFVTLILAALINDEPLTLETVAFATAVVVVVLAARKQPITTAA